MADRRRRNRRRGQVAAAGAVIVLVAAGTGIWLATRSSGPAYRLAVAQYASVSQSVDAVGTLASVNKAAVSFPVSGQVASVPVSLGEQVTAGQVLATLSTVSLNQTLAQANQTLASDQQRLANDQNDQTSAVTAAAVTAGGTAAGSAISVDAASERPLTSSGTGGTSGTGGSGGIGSGGTGNAAGSGGTGNGSQATSAVKAAQQKLTADQKALDAILSDDSLHDMLALTGPSGACAATASTTTVPALADGSGTVTVTTTLPATLTVDGTPLTAAATEAAGVYTYADTGLVANSAHTVAVTEQVIEATGCTAAIQKLVTALDPSPDGSAWALAQDVGSDELALQAAITALEQSAAKAGASGTSGNPSATAGTGSGAHAGTGNSSAASHSATPTVAAVTPQQVAADQAAVDSASAQVAVAQQNLAGTSITSPIAGRVEGIGLSVGSNAGSNAITVIGAGAFQVSTAVPLSEVALIKVGDTATVQVDGVSAALTGKVSAIGVLSTTTGSSTTYPVTILLDRSSAPLFDGSGAAVSIASASVAHVLTVPNSAVHTLGSLDTVTVLAGGKTTVTRVGVGVVGTDRTQVTSGLSAGQQVVLAQLDAPLPSSTNPLAGLRGTGLGGGTLRGGGLGGGSTTRGGGAGGTTRSGG